MQTGTQSVPTQTSRVRHPVVGSGADLVLLFTNWNAGEVPGSGDVTVKASIELGTGVHTVFFRGSRSAVVAPGGWVLSDPLGIAVDRGDVLWVRTTRTTSAAAPNVLALRASLGEGRADADLSDRDAVAVVADEATPAYGPVAVLAMSGPATAVALIGDSISNGVGETVREDGGYLTRALGDDIAYIRLNNGSGTARVYGDPQSTNTAAGRRRLALTSASTAAWVEFGINDLTTADTTLATVQASLTRLWTALARRGLDVHQSTITPNTSSTDGWATEEGQTRFAAHDVRIALNAWIRSTPEPLRGYFEAADPVETARDSGLWRPGFTADGVHPSTAGHTAAAAALRPAVALAFGGRVDPPAQVTGLTVLEVTVDSATLGWQQVEGATSYGIRHRASGTETWSETVVSAPPGIVGGLAPSTGYVAAVRSVGPGGVSAWSDDVPFQTPAPAIPPLPTTGLIARWVAEDLLPVGAGSAVVTWADRVSGYELTAATAARRPVLRTDGGPTRVVFDGTDDILDATTVRATGPTSEVIVFRLVAPSASGNQMLLSVPSSASTSGRRQLYAEGNGTTASLVARGSSVVSSGRASDTGWHAMGARFMLDGGRNGDVRVDGATVSGVLGTNTRQGVRLGASSSSVPVAIEVCEVLIYGSTTTDTWNQVFAHLAAIYGLPA